MVANGDKHSALAQALPPFTQSTAINRHVHLQSLAKMERAFLERGQHKLSTLKVSSPIMEIQVSPCVKSNSLMTKTHRFNYQWISVSVGGPRTDSPWILEPTY